MLNNSASITPLLLTQTQICICTHAHKFRIYSSLNIFKEQTSEESTKYKDLDKGNMKYLSASLLVTYFYFQNIIREE